MLEVNFLKTKLKTTWDKIPKKSETIDFCDAIDVKCPNETLIPADCILTSFIINSKLAYGFLRRKF